MINFGPFINHFNNLQSTLDKACLTPAQLKEIEEAKQIRNKKKLVQEILKSWVIAGFLPKVKLETYTDQNLLISELVKIGNIIARQSISPVRLKGVRIEGINSDGIFTFQVFFAAPKALEKGLPLYRYYTMIIYDDQVYIPGAFPPFILLQDLPKDIIFTDTLNLNEEEG